MSYPKLQKDPRCCFPGCPNPASHAELFTGIGIDPTTDLPYKRVRAVCKWHLGKRRVGVRVTVEEYGLEAYMELEAGQRVLEALQGAGETTEERLRRKVDTLKSGR